MLRRGVRRDWKMGRGGQRSFPTLSNDFPSKVRDIKRPVGVVVKDIVIGDVSHGINSRSG